MYEFRTMFIDADKKRMELEEKNELEGPIFKIRMIFVSPVSENFFVNSVWMNFPNFFNIIKGQMSLIGPRPLPTYEADKITGHAKCRLSTKSSITGLWQSMGRNKLSFGNLIALDLQYIDNWSLCLDLKILLRTVWIALTPKGAY